MHRQRILDPSPFDRFAHFTRHRTQDLARPHGHLRGPCHQQTAAPIASPEQHLSEIRRQDPGVVFLLRQTDLEPKSRIMEGHPDLPIPG